MANLPTFKLGNAVAERPIEDLTLRELFIAAERQTRDLVEHVDLNFLPNVDRLGTLVRPAKDGEEPKASTDRGVRNQVAQVLESEQYTNDLYQKLEAYFRAIDESVDRILEDSP